MSRRVPASMRTRQSLSGLSAPASASQAWARARSAAGAPAAASAQSVTASVVVSCSPATKRMSAGRSMPCAGSPARASGSLRSRASSRAETSPVCPPQAPQWQALACGLLATVAPWPSSSTSRAWPRDLCATMAGSLTEGR